MVDLPEGMKVDFDHFKNLNQSLDPERAASIVFYADQSSCNNFTRYAQVVAQSARNESDTMALLGLIVDMHETAVPGAFHKEGCVVNDLLGPEVRS